MNDCVQTLDSESIVPVFERDVVVKNTEDLRSIQSIP